MLKNKRLLIATTVYWFLLAYIIAQLAWWFIALQSQSSQMASYKMQELKKDDPYYETSFNAILAEQQRKTAEYVGEGGTFLILILIIAIFIYREVRRQIRLQEQQQNFMMAVTHELKTPIAVTKLNLETLLKHRLDEQKKQKILQTALHETDRLDTLTNNILIASQLEGGEHTRSKEPLDLSELVIRQLQEFRRRFADRKWAEDIAGEVEINGDPLLLQMLVSNLAENAVKYSPADATIGIGLRKTGRTIVFSVKDEGPGIPDEEKKKIFDKFYRMGQEKTRSTKGTGLGLYLCRKIARDHHATIKVQDNSPVGSIFTVTFSN